MFNSENKIKNVYLCSAKVTFLTEKEKREIHETFNADICDMESVGIVLTCELNNIPCLMLKGVSDGLTGGAGEFFEELTKAALICLKTADEIIKNM